MIEVQLVHWFDFFLLLIHNAIIFLSSQFYFFSASPSELVGHRIVLFSYGSGLASAMFSIKITKDLGPKLNKLLENLSNISKNLQNRVKVSPEEFDKTMKLREETHNRGVYMTILYKIINHMLNCIL